MKNLSFAYLFLLLAILGCTGGDSSKPQSPFLSDVDYTISYHKPPPDYKPEYPIPNRDALAKAYGFSIGQQMTINAVSEAFPDHSGILKLHKAGFDSQFALSVETIENELKKILGDSFIDFESNLHTLLKETNTNITPLFAFQFIEELEKRSKGQIESPILETFLTYQYFHFPAAEMLSGFTQQYSTAGHPKTKGVSLQLNLPSSWLKKEGNRPNVINTFTSNYGKGTEMILFMVRDLGLPSGYKLSAKELREFYTEAELKEMIPGNTSFISAKPIRIDGNLGGQLVYSLNPSLDQQLNSQFVLFSTIHDNKMIMIQAVVHVTDNDNLEYRFRHFFPLFQMVANSLVILDKYK